MAGDLVDMVVIGGGLAVILGIAWVLGRTDTAAQDDAWRRIAQARRRLHERERELLEFLDGDQCRRCPVWRRMRSRYRR